MVANNNQEILDFKYFAYIYPLSHSSSYNFILLMRGLDMHKMNMHEFSVLLNEMNVIFVKKKL